MSTLCKIRTEYLKYQKENHNSKKCWEKYDKNTWALFRSFEGKAFHLEQILLYFINSICFLRTCIYLFSYTQFVKYCLILSEEETED